MRASDDAAAATAEPSHAHGDALSTFVPVGRARNVWFDALDRFREDRVGMIGLALVVLPMLMVVTAQLSPYPYTEVHIQHRLQGPSATYLLGTDELGRDLLSRILWGSRVTIPIALATMVISALIGDALGISVAYYRGAYDWLAMRFADVMFAFPGLILALVLLAVLGPDIRNLVIALSFASIWGNARLARGVALSVGQEAYVESARAIGQRDVWIMLRYLLPNSLPPLIVAATAAVGGIVLAEAGLSFLGLGVQPPTPSWGMMLSNSRAYMEIAPWLAFAPGLAIFAASLGFALLGDGLRDALDPRLRGRI